LKLLVTIASYGEKNIPYLKRLIATYQAMSMTVDVVVVSEAPKELARDVRVVVGLPSSNPWSLPFAHKRIFAENVDNYDLFIYSEDDIAVTSENIEAFLQTTSMLKQDEIPGFLRYEVDRSNRIWMPDVHSMFRWKPDSVVERAGQLFAEYSNEHAACYMVTSTQLKRAIDGGRFMTEPYEGKYDMICTPATDLYTQCGFRKLIAVSNLKPFLLHHLSDRYAGQMGLSFVEFEEQLRVLDSIQAGRHPATTLTEVESRMNRGEWSKGLYEKPRPALLDLVPTTAKTVLSVGCGWGAAEEELTARGFLVTVIPLDSVIGAFASRRGLTPLYGTLDQCLTNLAGQKFDCLLVTNLLHLNENPQQLFARLAELTDAGGTLLVETPNFESLGLRAKRSLGYRDFQKLRTFAESGISVFGARALVKWSRRAGFSSTKVHWLDHSFPSLGKRKRTPSTPVRLGRFTAETVGFRATR